MSRTRAFTLLEILVVLAIITTLSAIAYPVFSQVKERVNQSSCASNIHQSWLAISLYRSDFDGADRYGNSYEMGLPPRLGTSGNLPEHLLKISQIRCPSWPSKFSSSGFSYGWMWQDPPQMNIQNRWDDYAKEYQDGSVLITDVNHNDPNMPLFSVSVSKLGFGATIGGNALRLRKPGDPDILRWWTTSCITDCRLR